MVSTSTLTTFIGVLPLLSSSLPFTPNTLNLFLPFLPQQQCPLPPTDAVFPFFPASYSDPEAASNPPASPSNAPPGSNSPAEAPESHPPSPASPFPNPYTYDPNCIHLPHTPLNPTAEPLCVYTTTTYRSHPSHGISLITFPSVASSLYSAFTVPPDVTLNTTAWGLTPGPVLGGPSGKQPAWIVFPIPGKGLATVAARPIQKGETIAWGWPSLLASIQMPKLLSQRRGEMLVDVAVERLDGEQVEREILGLARGKMGEAGGGGLGVGGGRGGRIIEDVLRTNIFAVEVGGGSLMGLFGELSRMNHACNPNAHPKFSQSTLLMEVFATRDIEVGEEITISYSRLGSPTPERLSHLSRIYNFKCTCALCTRSPPERLVSDNNRKRLREIRTILIPAKVSGDYRALQRGAIDLHHLPPPPASTSSSPSSPDQAAAGKDKAATGEGSGSKEQDKVTTLAAPGASTPVTLTPETLSSLSEELHNLVHTEGLESQLGYYHEFLARGHLRVGDAAGARKWAVRAAENWEEWEGGDDEHVHDAHELVGRIDRGEFRWMRVEEGV